MIRLTLINPKLSPLDTIIGLASCNSLVAQNSLTLAFKRKVQLAQFSQINKIKNIKLHSSISS